MKRYTKKQLKEMIQKGIVKDITYGTDETKKELDNKEGYITKIGYAAGVYGCNGMLLKGNNTNTLYAITEHTNAIYIFG